MKVATRLLFGLILLAIVIVAIVTTPLVDKGSHKIVRQAEDIASQERYDAALLICRFISDKYPVNLSTIETRKALFKLTSSRQDRYSFSLAGFVTESLENHPIVFFAKPPFISTWGILLFSTIISLTGIFIKPGALRKLMLLSLCISAGTLLVADLLWYWEKAGVLAGHHFFEDAFPYLPVLSYSVLGIILLVIASKGRTGFKRLKGDHKSAAPHSEE